MSLRIILGGAWGEWQKASRTFQIVEDDIVPWDDVTEEYFAASQDVVHVISGRLKASGDLDNWIESDRWRSEIEYSAPYAAFEFIRGGDHDAMTRAYELVRDKWQDSVGRSIERAVDRQFGGKR